MSAFDSLPESQRKKAKTQIEDYLAKVSSKEREFFNKTGVQQKITTYGHAYTEKDYDGWYFSEEGLKKLGVKNVVVNASTWEPRKLSEKVRFLKVEVNGI